MTIIINRRIPTDNGSDSGQIKIMDRMHDIWSKTTNTKYDSKLKKQMEKITSRLKMKQIDKELK